MHIWLLGGRDFHYQEVFVLPRSATLLGRPLTIRRTCALA